MVYKFDFLRKMPFLCLLVPLSSGVALARFLPEWLFALWFLVVLFFLLLFFAWFSLRRGGHRYDNLFFFAMTFFLICSGGALFYRSEGCLWNAHNGSGDVVKAYICSGVEKRATSMKCEAKVSGGVIAKDMGGGEVKLQLFLSKDSLSLTLREGDYIAFPDDLFRQDSPNPNSFDYTSYLRVKGISGSLYIPSAKWTKLGHDDSFSLGALARRVQSSLLRKFSEYGISGDEFALLSAMVLGKRGYMSQQLRESYTNTGSAHVLAVSGLHVGAVCYILSLMLSFIFRGARFEPLRNFLLIVVLWVYAFVTGLSPSVVRASFMVTFFSFSRIIRRDSNVYNSLFSTAFFMLLINPFYLFDIGFQLSFMAVLSIVYFQPRISALIHTDSFILEKLWSLLSVSLAAQLGTLPISLYYFHSFSFVFWLSGIVVVLLSSLAIYLSASFFLLSGFPLLCGVVTKAIIYVAVAMNESVRLLESVPRLLFQHIPFGVSSLLLAYLFVLFIGIYCAYKRLFHLRLALLSLSLCFFVSIVLKFKLSQDDFFVVYNVKGVSALNAIGHAQNGLYCSSKVPRVEQCASGFWSDNFASEPSFRDFSGGTMVGNLRILHLRERKIGDASEENKLSVDVLILGSDVNYSIWEIKKYFSFRYLVFDSSNSYSYLNRMRRACEKGSVSFHDVSRSGAFVLKCNTDR